ncbi:hybrid sensor histidine kinase/response regulator [Alcanivorax sp. 1008]|uniref:hybrid sensor histidine kinase/response regulator n=1 Tax=Alcanivorax sp. 1008 TaxID=2816853 RepID=UPI001D909CCB|nr:response regulator [Alcanivorax sp. 1008]
MQDFRLTRGLAHLLLLTMLLAPIGASAALLSSGSDDLLTSMLWLRDPEQQLGPREALKRLQDTGNINDRGKHPAFGFDRGAIWFLIPLSNDTNEQDWILQAGRPHMDSLDLFLFDQQDQLVGSFRHGDQIPWSERPYPHTNLLFPLELKPEQDYRLVFRAASVGAIELPLAIMPPYSFQQYDTTFQNFVGLYLGAIGVMLLFNLLLYLSIRDRSYLMYCLYLTGLLGYLTSREGLPFKLLWPEQPWLNNPVQAASAILGIGFMMLFANDFMRLRKARPRMERAVRYTGWSLVILAPLSTLVETGTVLRIVTAGTAFLVLPVIAITIDRIRAGYHPARYFLLSFSPFAVMVFLFMLKTYSFIDSNWLIDHGFEVGSMIEAWLLSFALAHRFIMLRDENERIQREATVELEQRVIERTRELHNALNARSQFLAVMSHEIRTPLNGIIGTVEMLKDGIKDAEHGRHLHVIEQSGNTLLALINDILDYSSIESGKMPIISEQFNLSALATETVGLYTQNAKAKGLLIDLQLDSDIGTLCQGDPVRLRQILGNLISNAVKFTEHGEVTVHLQRDHHNSDYVLFEVEDTGIGIAPDTLSELFELFQQADSSTRRRYGGTGLGLAICRQLVELIGGEIGVQSTPGKGSRFWFRLPLPQTSVEQRQAEAVDRAGKNRTPQVRLLIVDDNHVNLLVAQGLARKLGHLVEVAESGPEAIAVLLNDSRPYDLILMDCEMPDMDGFETSAEIIRLQNEGKIPPIPIVALTAHAVPDKIRACHEAGMISHLAKPINSEKLDRELRNILHLE